MEVDRVKMPFTAGLQETRCGAGSMLANTADIREWLPNALAELEIGILLDAPCGDFNWMAHTDLSGVHYIGCDYDEEHCRCAFTRESQPSHYRPRSKSVTVRDICHDRLPHADLMLCRDFLQHLPNKLVAAVFERFAASGIPWLLATSHLNSSNEDIATPGMFRALNLTAAPFNLPRPRRSATDSSRILGLWHRNELVETC